jgi:adenylate cyclase
MPSTTADVWLDWIAACEKRADHFSTADVAAQAIADYPDDVRIQYKCALALARAGARSAARERAELLERSIASGAVSPQLVEDIRALSARLLKDDALDLPPKERPAMAKRAAIAYEEIFQQMGSYYTCINAATMWMLAGDAGKSRSLAQLAIAQIESGSAPLDYWQLATLAEARLLLGETGGAADALARAITVSDGSLSNEASTRRQLLLICWALQLDHSFLDRVADLAVTVMRFPISNSVFHLPSDERLGENLAKRQAGLLSATIFLPIWEPAHVAIAEGLLQAGARIEVVLPFGRQEMREAWQRDCGAAWSARLEECVTKACFCYYVTRESCFSDPELLRLANDMAEGLANLRASFLASRVHKAIPIGCGDLGARAGADFLDASDRLRRHNKAIIFGDFRGFSKLQEKDMYGFKQHIMDAIGALLNRYESFVEHRESQGDGLMIVFSDIVQAAHCLLEMQRLASSLDLNALGLPGHLALRLGGHSGPLFYWYDGVERRSKFYGSELVRAARIEPITPPGGVYVSEQFAAQLFLASPEDFASEYVGEVPSAKGYGAFRMYSLRRRLS